MEEKIKVLEGITYKEWQKIKIIIDNKFSDIMFKSTLHIDEDTFNELNAIN